MSGHCLSTQCRPAKRGRRGFSLTEVVACLVVLAVLGAVAVPAVSYGRDLARDAGCKGHLKRLWIATSYYSSSHSGYLFVNRAHPLRISNVIYKDRGSTGWGTLYPRYLEEYHVLFCPSDPGRGPAWEHGWSNWGEGLSEVQCSYGYRGRHGFARSPSTALCVASIEHGPGKVLGCDYYEPFFAPPRVHHAGHINVLRCNGQVEQVEQVVSFGPRTSDFEAALDALDR
jgi:prepilin-type N-terminal cleavage/methylation domain-containing protein